ncbi:hypothetical protein GCM10022268_04570 [Sphingomonas cynarae]|uniref:Transposase n=1 Tax=Sphingomonas cynarae TaxID=930197 RepID=A0ABP7CVZ1_9SPHN
MSGDRNVGTIERAFQLARSGACHSVEEIRVQLSAERHDRIHEHLGGISIQRQLKALLVGRGVKARADDDDGAG